MNTKIAEYQKALLKIKDELQNNKNVVAAMVYGSMVNGDIWHGSNIDLLLVLENDFENIKDFYVTENQVPIHLKLISKNVLFNEPSKKIIKILRSSRVIICNDDSINRVIYQSRYITDSEKGNLNLVYLGEVLKYINLLKKYIFHERKYTYFELSIKCIDAFSKLYINNSGYSVTKDSINMACSLNDSFKEIVGKIFFQEEDKGVCIEELVKYIDGYIHKYIKNYCASLIDFIKYKNSGVTSQRLKEDETFKALGTNMEEILLELHKHDILQRKVLEQSFSGFRYKENVYFYKGI